MRDTFKILLAVFGVINVFYWFTVMAALPSEDYLSKTTIEGYKYCFHSDDGRYVDYYTKRLDVHIYEGYFINKNSSLEDDYKAIGEELRFYDKVRSNN